MTSMAQFPWEEMTGRWRELFEEQAKVTQLWHDSQAQLAKTLAGVSDPEANPAANAGALADLWRSGMGLSSLGESPAGLESPNVANAALGKMFDPMSMSLLGGNQVGDLIRRMTEGPRLADVGSVERRMARVMELYVEVQTAARSHEALVAGAWMEANQSFAASMAKNVGSAETVTAKDALRLWLKVADEALTKTHRSPTFLEAQRRLLRAGMDYLLAERELVEMLIEPSGLPTRSEIDELHRTVYTLKREVRALRRAASTQPAPPSRAKQAATRPRATASKRKKETEG